MIKLFTQKAKILSPQMDMYKRLEHVGRVCYNSYKNVSEDSAKRFVDGAIKVGHTSILEHARVLVPLNRMLDKTGPFQIPVKGDPGKRLFLRCREPGMEHSQDANCVSVNMRDYLEIFGEIESALGLPVDHQFYTFELSTSIGIQNELVRHRVMSFMVQSTRYVDISAGLPVLYPFPYDWAGLYDGPLGKEFDIKRVVGADMCKLDSYLEVAELAAETYPALIASGMTKQEARDILPKYTGTTMFMSGTTEQWMSVFKLRCPKSAHPQIRLLMYEILTCGGSNNNVVSPESRIELLNELSKRK